jgi:glycosyltransferase involved in cell wall biosynthesis
MRILKVTQSYAPFLERGGPAVKVRALARGLSARGHKVTVLTADLGHGRRGDLGEKSAWGWRSIEENVESIYLPTAFSFRALTVNPRLLSFCRARLADFDIVHIYGLYDLLGPAMAWQAARRPIPYLVEPMGMYRSIDRAFFLKSVWRQVFGNRMIASAGRMIVTSELEREDLAEGGIQPERIRLRYNPVDLAEYATLPPRGIFRNRWQIPPDDPLVLFLSRLIPRKGADLLIESVSEALPERGTLVIAGPEGETGYLDYLRTIAERCGITSRVRFTGPLYGEEKKEAFADADVFALPSSYENFANVAAEAIASGVPVVVTDRCGIHALVGGRAGLVVPREKAVIAKALRQLMEDQDMRNRLRTSCRAVAEELSLEKTVASLEIIYAEQTTEPNHTARLHSPTSSQAPPAHR